MEVDDNGKERRNALIVSAAIASAAFLQLKMPSFLAEYIKFEIAPEHAYRVWIMASLVALYALMRFHFSDSRVHASQIPAAAFAQKLDTALSAKFGRSSTAGEAHRNWEIEVSNFAMKQGDIDYVQAIDRRHFEPFGHMHVPGGIYVHWRIRRDVLNAHAPTSDKYPEITNSVHTVKWFPRQLVRVQSVAARVFWSKIAWEVNTVYVISGTAILASIARAYTLY